MVESITRKSCVCGFTIQIILVVGIHKKKILVVFVYIRGVLIVGIHNKGILVV